MTEPRKLSYPNRYLLSLVQSTDVDCLGLDEQFYFPDNTTNVNLVWNINYNDFTEVFSALMFGADLAYPDTAQNVVMKFLKMVCANVDLCTEIADCIENNTTTQNAIAIAIQNNPDIQSAINQIINNNNYGRGDIYSPVSYMADNVIPASALCTSANKYAMAQAIVQKLDDLANDFLEVIALLTTKQEIAAEMVSGIPIFGGIASLALDVAVFINDYVRTTYAAAYNSTTELDYACAVYCAFEGCDLSWDMVISAYEGQANITPPQNTDFITLMQWFVTNVIPSGDNLIVGAMHVFVLNALKYGSDWFGSGVWTALDIAVQNASDEEITVPGSCDCPSDWCNLFDFTTSQQSFSFTFPARPYGIWTNGAGFQMEQSTISGQPDNRCYIRRIFSQSFTVDNFLADYIGTAGGSLRGATLFGYLNGNLVFSHALGVYTIGAGTYTYTATHTVDELLMSIVTNTGSTPNPDAFTLENLKIEGSTGTGPETTNC